MHPLELLRGDLKLQESVEKKTLKKRSDQWYRRLAVHKQTEAQTVDPANFGSQSGWDMQDWTYAY